MMSYQNVIAKINNNTEKCTDFYDFAESHGYFERKLNVNVTPQLEEIDFYGGERIIEYDYVPESSKRPKHLEWERESGIRKETQLDELFDNFKHGHVCFVGPPGSGKTTLMKATSRDVMHGKYFHRIIKMVSYIECKQFMRNSKVTAAELIFNNLTKEERSQAIDIAKTHPEEVLFLLDALDTFQYTVDGVYEVIGLDERAYPEVIMWNFLSGKLFPGCRIISSSREHSIRNFWGEIRPNKVIALAGLTMKSIKEIISGYEGDEEAEKIMEFLKIEAPLLLFLCTTPVMLVYTLIALKFKSDFKPNTMSGIMIVVMQSILRSPHTHQEITMEVLGKLKDLSYIGTIERRVLFTEDDFRQVHLKPEEATDLAILAPGGIYRKVFQGIHLLYFQHQTFQEMLTSFYILGLDLKTFREFVDEHLHTGYFVFVRRMICGFLLNTRVYKAAGILLEEITDLEEKRDIFKKSLQSQLKKISGGSDLLEVFTAMNEAKDGMSDIVKSSLNEISMTGHPLSISDIHVIGSVVSYCTSLTLDFTRCDLKSASLQTLASGLKESNAKIMKLWLNKNTNMGVEGLTSVGQILSNQSCVEELGLGNCNLSSDQLQAFKSSIGNRTTLMKLYLYGNTNMGVEGLLSVGQILSSQSCVEELGLAHCNLSSDQLQAFKSSIGNKTKLINLWLSGNTNMGVEALSSVGRILFNQSCVEALYLANCNLSSDQLQALKSSLGSTEIMKLYLSGNTNMGVEGLLSVGQILSNQSCVEELSLDNCNLSSDQLQAFKSSLGITKIDQLYLGEDRIANNEDIVAVANLLPNVTESLWLGRWKIADEDKEILQNQLDEIGSEKLEICLDRFTKLKSRRISAATIKVFSKQHPTTTSKTEFALPKIENVSSQRSGSDILLTWNEVSDGNVLYSVEIFCDDVKLEGTHTTEVPQYRMESPTLGKKYIFQVWAKDELGNSSIKTQSKNVIKLVNVEVAGGSMRLNECKVTFPGGTFNKQTKVWMSVGIDNSLCPEGYIGITPVFDISADSEFLKDAIVQIQSWCVGLEKDKIDILHFSSKTDWNIIKPRRITGDNSIEFRCRKFSPVMAFIRWLLFGTVELLMEHRLYILNKNKFHFAFFTCGETVQNTVRHYYKDLGAQLAPFHLPQILLQIGDRVRMKLQIDRGPENLHFDFPDGHTFLVDKQFLRKQRNEYTVQLFPVRDQYPQSNIRYKMVKEGNEPEICNRDFDFPVERIDMPGQQTINFYGDVRVAGNMNMNGDRQQALQDEQIEQREAEQQRQADENRFRVPGLAPQILFLFLAVFLHFLLRWLTPEITL